MNPTPAKYALGQTVFWITDMGGGVKKIFKGTIYGIQIDAELNYIYMILECWMTTQQIPEANIFDNQEEAFNAFYGNNI